ncbi:MAG: type II toxin-antitoxin system mRNA interferase toxin, RelE/StbE family [Candidatus Omnitrophica bacterium CG11_big_fil_rev_8_21_14_0_20_64_10]|nr:MAG: type II toxin-antitoxin system mRNA interferase toxin, RelE/StbE family [Candidatus Omnitrophica bacterium CG11_big_fil_rev_8_21_14_0_20_64_10]
MTWKLTFTSSARREITKLSPDVLKQIQGDLAKLIEHPQEGKHLSGRYRGLRSWRSGDYRILYGIRPAKGDLIVYRLAHRREAYR